MQQGTVLENTRFQLHAYHLKIHNTEITPKCLIVQNIYRISSLQYFQSVKYGGQYKSCMNEINVTTSSKNQSQKYVWELLN